MRTNFVLEFHIPKREKMRIPTRVRKHLIRELQLKEYCVDTSSSSALLCGQELLLTVWCHIGLQATTTEISSYMIWQSYWKLYQAKSSAKCSQ
jgi:hypothetical protein